MNRITLSLQALWEQRPLRLILWIALGLRLCAVIFSKGYGWHDDHFLTVEPPHSWVHGQDYNNWLPSSNHGEFKPSGHSFTYSGIMFGVFSCLEGVGITDPQTQMLLIRFLHALFSLLLIYYAYRIAEKWYGMPIARMVGLFLAVFYFMPFLSVRNLVEMVCIPFLMGGTWYLIKDDTRPWKLIILSGVFFGMAFSIRYQTILFSAGTGLVLLFTFPFLRTLVWGLSMGVLILISQGLVDYMIWGVPFAEFWEYTTYNQTAGATDYFVREWYLYFIVLAGILVPPLSLIFIGGFVAGWRKALIISVPVVLFLAFHSWFPNKQERFILPIVPFLIVVGYGGFMEWVGKGDREGWKRFAKISLVIFWILNVIALGPITFMYSKRSRVEAMSYLGKQADYISYIIEDSNNSKITMLPDFYSGKSYSSWRIMEDIPAQWVHEQVMFRPLSERPNYMLFMFEDKLQQRVDSASRYFSLEKMTEVEPSMMDQLLHWLNPYNRNEKIFIYRIRWEK